MRVCVNIVCRLQSYEDRVTAYAKSVATLALWKYDTGFKKASDGLVDATARYKEEVCCVCFESYRFVVMQ